MDCGNLLEVWLIWRNRIIPNLIMKKSIMVGNSESDIVFGKNLGMKTVFIGESQAHDALLTYPSLFKFAEAL